MAAVSSSPEISLAGKGEIMLFGVRVVIDPMRKCVSLNNLSDYEKSPAEKEIIGDGEDKIDTDLTAAVADGYASANDAVQISSSSCANRKRKRGVAWSESEHKRFLLGLQRVGKGDWKGISRNFVKSRTPTQVASHAQKHFLRRTNLNRRRQRSSLFDITTDTVKTSMEQDQVHHAQENSSRPETNINAGHVEAMQVFPEVALQTRTENASQIFCPNESSSVTDSLSLNLSLSYNFNEESKSRHPAFGMMPSLSDGDSNNSIIRVA
ncbi:unnamed protein product [Cochlearia groenlandica]